MKLFSLSVGLILSSVCSFPSVSHAEPIYHKTSYPAGDGPFPVVIALHTSGGFKTVQKQISKYTSAGYAVYAPDYFRRHGITMANRFETWTTHRARIEMELIEIVEVIKSDPRTDARNIFAVGFSNGGYWAGFLAARRHVNAGASHYGVWRWPSYAGWNGYPAKYFEKNSNPVLAIHGDEDTIQKPRFVYDQIEIAESLSPKFKKHIFSNVGHSWDCKRCRKDGYDAAATKIALQKTLELFNANKR